MDITKNFFIMQVVKQWNRCSSEVADAPCLSVFKWLLVSPKVVRLEDLCRSLLNELPYPVLSYPCQELHFGNLGIPNWKEREER